MANYRHNIDESTAAALRAATFEGGLLRMPQMDKAIYAKVAKVLGAVGGKWNTRAKGFPFSEDPRPGLLAAADVGHIVDERKMRQAFFTPEDVARDVCIHADPEGCSVLEPSAGHGALVRAAFAAGARVIQACEIDRTSCDILKTVEPTKYTWVWCGDFMKFQPDRDFDRVIMNPPFSKGAAAKHIVKAYGHLRSGGRLTAIMPLNKNGWFERINAEVVQILPEGTFREAGTNISTMIVVAVKP